MTGQEILTKFENMVDDSIDQEYALQLLNDAREEVESMHDWEMLKTQYSFATTAGGTVDTNYTLPSDFSFPISLYDDGRITYDLIPYEDRRKYIDQSYTYVIDYKNNNLQITQTIGESKTMYLFYIAFSSDIAVLTSWSFPDRFHSILAYKMAEIYYAKDGGEKSRAWDDRWSNQYERMLERMQNWDTKIKIRARRAGTKSIYSPKAINSLNIR